MKTHLVIGSLGHFDVEVYANGGGNISSSFHSDNIFEDDTYNAQIDIIESLVLAHAAEGVDIEAQDYVDGLETTLESIGNQQ